MPSAVQAAPPRAAAADVARYLVEKTEGGMAQLKLQKLLYYCQAASLGWTNRPMFEEPIEAWINGPVVKSIWDTYAYQGWIDSVAGGDLADREARAIADQVYEHYGQHEPDELSRMTHSEPPWREARATLRPGERGNVEITVDAMRDYYSHAWQRTTGV